MEGLPNESKFKLTRSPFK